MCIYLLECVYNVYIVSIIPTVIVCDILVTLVLKSSRFVYSV